MQIQIDLPEQLRQRLSPSDADIVGNAREAVIVDLYRRGYLSRPELTAALGRSRLEMDAVLKAHGVTEDLITVEDFVAERAADQ